MSGVTYGELLATASARIAAGVDAIRAEPFASRDHARQALVDYHGVLDALETHAWTLLGTSHRESVRWMARYSPVVADTLGAVAGLRDLLGRRPHPSVMTRADRDWPQAGLHLRAAADLIETHRDPVGQPRSPDGVQLRDPGLRDAALVRLASQLDAVLAVEDSLGLRALQAGLTRQEVKRQLPGFGPNRAHTVHLMAGVRRQSPNLDGLRLRSDAPRIDDPVLHVADLVQRLRQHAWATQGTPACSVATLSDLASAGLILNAHAAAAHGTDLTRNPVAPTAEGAAFLRASKTWRNLRSDLAAYRAPEPPDPTVRADVLEVRDLLAHLAPLDATPPADPRTPGVLRSASSISGEIARDAGHTFRTFAEAGHLRIHSGDLTPEQLGEDPELITARLHRDVVAAPASRWKATAEFWSEAARTAVPSLSAIPAPAHDLNTARAALALAHRPPERA